MDSIEQTFESIKAMKPFKEQVMKNAAVCPMHAAPAPSVALDAADELALPLHKRMVVQYATNEDGNKELRLFYGDKEISFDEPDLFAFGEAIGKQSRFVAGTATTWGGGYEWPRVKELLEQLITEGVLQYADELDDDATAARLDGARPSPLPPALTTVPRTWFESADITAQITGRALEPGYLELVVPIFRVAHMSMDADGRQVGEANVFPPALRLDIPTRWRTCIYEGTRHQVDRPMNVTALKSMRAHWGQMMAALLKVREAYLERFPAARRGWTVGDLERLSTAVLALPAFVLMRSDRRVENGDLHPALSSMFRVTDGVRMTMHQMLFVPIGEPVLAPDAPMSGAEIYAYAERNFSFHSGHGVCAGPRAMIEEFLAVLVDGVPPKGGLPAEFDPQVSDALADLDAVLDYAMLGLQAYASVFSIWPVMSRTYEKLGSIAGAWAGSGNAAVTALRDRMQQGILHIAKTGFLATEERRANRESVYADMYAQCEFGLTGGAPAHLLPEQIAPQSTVHDETAGLLLRAALVRKFGAAVESATGIDDLHACLMDFLRRTQAILRVAGDVQRRINVLLDRTPPRRAFSAADINIHIRLRGDIGASTPYLLDDLEDVLGIDITLDHHQMVITDRIKTAAA
jgi:hypothetical protein